jgi:hypothetical protein
MLLAEDLLLLVTDDASGPLSAPATQVDAGLGGANLAGPGQAWTPVSVRLGGGILIDMAQVPDRCQISEKVPFVMRT